MEHISRPIGRVMKALEKRAKPTFKKPDHLTLHKLTGDVRHLVDYEREAEKEQRK